MVRRILFVFGVIGWIAAASLAQPATSPAQPLTIPARDRLALARELLGVTAVAHTPAPPAKVGDVRTFYVLDINTGERRPFEAVLVAAGRHATVWVDLAASVPPGEAQSLIGKFDDVVYPAVRGLWGSEDIPGIDGDPRLKIVLAGGIAAGTAAYYSSDDRFPAAIVPFSSEADLFYVSLAAADRSLDRPQVVTTLAHEFQHMIRDHRGENPQTWLNEGLSTYTELALGQTIPAGVFAAFQRRPGIQLTDWTLGPDRGAHYGAAGLFVTYVAQRYGQAGLTALAGANGPGLIPAQTMLAAVDPAVDAETLLADWVAANYLRVDGSDVYGYRSVTLPAPAAQRAALGTTVDVSLPPYATAFYTIDPGDIGALTIDVSADPNVPMLPTAPASGDHFWVPLRADDSAASLTHEFDLTGASSPELWFDLWYNLEDNYDYLLLTATADGGATWQILEPDSAVASPYGPALTGYSGGWHTERVRLDDFVGQRVRVRWLVITDDALTEPGVALDDIAIDAIGFRDDTEQGIGAWTAAGWVLTDNRIEASVWVQVMQRTDDGVRVDRQRVYGSGRLEVEVLPDARDVAIAVTPLADMTTEPIGVSLVVNEAN